jgi:hypothetical protein
MLGSPSKNFSVLFYYLMKTSVLVFVRLLDLIINFCFWFFCNVLRIDQLLVFVLILEIVNSIKDTFNFGIVCSKAQPQKRKDQVLIYDEYCTIALLQSHFFAFLSFNVEIIFLSGTKFLVISSSNSSLKLSNVRQPSKSLSNTWLCKPDTTQL